MSGHRLLAVDTGEQLGPRSCHEAAPKLADDAALVHLTRPPAGDAGGLLVLLHGRGADENDLFPLLDYLDPERRLIGVTARAPLGAEPGGPPGGYHWYVTQEMGHPHPATWRASLDGIIAWLDALGAHTGVPLTRTVIGGFSQGAVMAHSLVFGPEPRRTAGLLALSGFMPIIDGMELDLAGLNDWPVALGHGTQDPVIGVEWSRTARRRLEAAGAEVTYRESPMGHAVDPAYLGELAGWIHRVLPPRPPSGW